MVMIDTRCDDGNGNGMMTKRRIDVLLRCAQHSTRRRRRKTRRRGVESRTARGDSCSLA